MTILPGAWIFLSVVIVLLFALAHGLYTRSGSGINAHPHRNAPDHDGRDGLALLGVRGTR